MMQVNRRGPGAEGAGYRFTAHDLRAVAHISAIRNHAPDNGGTPQRHNGSQRMDVGYQELWQASDVSNDLNAPSDRRWSLQNRLIKYYSNN
jgi:hypothetical protein